MKILTIYMDTSVLGGCYDDEFSIWSNGLIKDFEEGNFIPVLSTIVETEVELAPEKIKEKLYMLLELDHIMLEPDRAVIELADEYIKRKIVSENFYDDALHIALATKNNIDVLVSWNFKHIVHFDKISKFNSVNIELGYKQIVIYSPREVTNYGKD